MNRTLLDLDLEIYPYDEITMMKNDRYCPVIIGNAHRLEDLPEVKKAFLTVRGASPALDLKVSHEILPPVQLQYIKDFVSDEREYAHSGTLNGVAPEEGLVDALRSYRPKLAKHHAEALAIWLLDQGFNVISLEHDNALEWSNRVDGDMNLKELAIEYVGEYEAEKVILFYKDIDRDIHNLKRMNSERPDIISVGTVHGVIFDFLLERNGNNSIYIPESNHKYLLNHAELFRAAQSIYKTMHRH